MAKNGNSEGRRELAALALAGGRNCKDAAAAAGCAERTLRSWMADAAFKARVQQLRTDLFSAAVGRLADLAVKAADTLGGLLDSASEGVRLRAATAVLGLGARTRECLDVLEQLRALEEAIANKGAPP
jgi:hypothetical protein